VFAFALIPISISVIISFIFEDSVITGENFRSEKLHGGMKSIRAK
jgi:hypothetical protein